MPTQTLLKERNRHTFKLPTSLTLGPIQLTVRNLSVMKNFYGDVMGLEILSEDKDTVTLGIDKKPLVILVKSDLPLPIPADAGLYHFALVFSSRSVLARMINRIITLSPQSFSGSSDHLVSEAFYFYDPQGNGIELYFDRKRSMWQWENGQIKMATLYIDPNEYIKRYSGLRDTNTNLDMGHIHLKVGDIDEAQRFYVDIVGFDITTKLPGALFISVGGYHHHIGLNTWESQGTGKRKDTIGLGSFELILPTRKDLGYLKKRLRKNNIPIEVDYNSIRFADPWNNQIRVLFSS